MNRRYEVKKDRATRINTINVFLSIIKMHLQQVRIRTTYKIQIEIEEIQIAALTTADD